MSRRVPWRRNCPDVVSCRIEDANQARIYLLRETGPTGFLIKEDGVHKTFKVFLGDLHSCTCGTFMKEKELCIHILWILLKKFRVPKENSVVFQLSLVEREINEVMRGAYIAKRPVVGKEKTHQAVTENREKLKQKEVTEEDVCPICQEELLDQCEPLTFCKYGCGNSIHIKCMKIWAEHQRSTGEKITKCPLCRVDFGTFQELVDEFNKSSRKKTRSERHDVHLGAACQKCRLCPITGKCYRCVVCSDYHLCHQCYTTDHHMQHSFQFRQKPSQRWRPATRITPLPNAVMDNLQNRDITDNDYDLLLQLDRPLGEQEGIEGHVLSNLPVEVLREGHPLVTGSGSCGVCLSSYRPFQSVRKLHCHHVFHRDCIDSWLANHGTCPTDGQSVSGMVRLQNVAPPTISIAGQGRHKARLLGRRREGRHQGEMNSQPVSLPSSFELSGSGILVRDRSRDNSPGEGYARGIQLIDCSPNHLIESTVRRIKTQQPVILSNIHVSGRPPLAPNTTPLRGSNSSDSRKRTPAGPVTRTTQRRNSLGRERQSNSPSGLVLSATGRAVSMENLSRDVSVNKKTKGQLIKGKLTGAKNSSISHSDSELMNNETLLVASGLAIHVPNMDVYR